MVYYSLVFALLIAFSRVRADDDEDEGMKSCVELFNPNRPMKHCCTEVKPFKHQEEHIKECKNKEWTACEETECIMQKYGTWDGNEIVYEKVYQMMDEYEKENPDLKHMVDRVKKNCKKGKFEGSLPDEICLAFKFQICLGINSVVECQKWDNDDGCQEIKELAQKCKPALDKLYAS